MNSATQTPADSKSETRLRVLVFTVVFAIAMTFAAYTNHAWEDYYITYRVSKNAATGQGLVFTPGERVHVFTSPINVLVPALLSMMTGNHSDELVLWLFRVLSSLILAAAAVLLLDSARKNSLGALATFVLLGLFCLDAKIVDFSINGQEIAFMMFFLALAIHALTVPSRWTALRLGLAWTGLMWTRPDGFIYFGLIAIGFFLFNAGRLVSQSRMGLLKVYVVAGLITTVLYLPWFLWAWHYFGSPIPHTIIAKAHVRITAPLQPGPLVLSFFTFPFEILLGMTAVDDTFFPTYASSFGDWHWSVLLVPRLVAYACALYWLVPRGRPQGRAVSFAFMISQYYLSEIAPYPAPWYLTTCEIMAIFVFAHMVQHGLEVAAVLKEKHPEHARGALIGVRALSGLAVAATVILLICSAYQLRIQEKEIELGNRKQIGLWLHEHASSPNDTVFLEPLGYIGYFSQLKMFDIPGLSSPEVVAAEERTKSTSRARLIPELKPDWLVLRAIESGQIQNVSPRLLTEDYSAVKVFDVSQRIASYSWLPGRGYLNCDETYIVFKRNKPQEKTGHNGS